MDKEINIRDLSFGDNNLVNIDLEIEEMFLKTKESLNFYFFRNHYINNLALHILASLIEFSQIYNKSTQIHICLKPLILYIFDRILKLTDDQFNSFLKANVKIKRKYLQHIISLNKNSLNFYIQCSSDIAYNFNLDNMEEIIVGKQGYYKVQCHGLDELEYKCTNYYIIVSSFLSNNNSYYTDVPFSLLENPNVFAYNNRLFENIDIYLIKLCKDGEFLLIFPDGNAIDFYNFLHTANIEDIVKNSKLMSAIKWLALPFMTEIECRYHNIHRILDNVQELENFLFIDKDDSKEQLKNIDFQIYSQMKILNNHSNSNFDNNFPKECLTINKPFLYLFLNNNFIIKSGGMYDAHMQIKDQSQYQRIMVNEKF